MLESAQTSVITNCSLGREELRGVRQGFGRVGLAWTTAG
jgi:hypothetical protein